MDLSTALLGAFLLYLINSFKDVLAKLFNLVLGQYIASLSVHSAQSEFSIISKYVYHIYAEYRTIKTNNYRLSLLTYDVNLGDASAGDVKNPNQFQLDSGIYFFKHPEYGHALVKVEVYESQANLVATDWASRANFGQTCTIYIKFLKRDVLPLFVSHAIDYAVNQKANYYLRAWDSQENVWTSDLRNLGRPWSQVILPQEQKQRIFNDVQQFFRTKAVYDRLGVPYRRGLLLAGPPGTGKTTVVKGLQHSLKIPLHVISLSQMTDASLLFALRTILTEQALVLFEDIDVCTGVLHKRQAQKPSHEQKLSLAGFLNAVDGVQSPTGVYFIFTTNDALTLDEAVLRTGRVDCKEQLEYLDRELQQEFMQRCFGEVRLDLIQEQAKASDVQALCLQHLLNQGLTHD